VPGRPYTLSVDCGGTGLKCQVVDADGHPVTRRVRVRTPYPCPPDVLARELVEMGRATAHSFQRVSVGMPGLVRHGIVRWTPHYVTEAGPFTAVRPDLVDQWVGLDVRSLLSEAYGRPTLVLNDAEIAGLSVIEGSGYEAMLTIGTGLGFAHFADGVPLPKIEVSAGLFRDGQTFDQQLGHHARRQVGPDRWTDRVEEAITSLHAVFYWDQAYLGGGATKHLVRPLDVPVQIVANAAGVLGGVRLWDDPHARRAALPPGTDDAPLPATPVEPSSAGSPATG
jgi:polyphosphate glucokinase